jgi:hypothetical protein
VEFQALYTQHYANQEKSKQHQSHYMELDKDLMALMLNQKRSYNSLSQTEDQGGEIKRYLALCKFIVIIIVITTNFY